MRNAYMNKNTKIKTTFLVGTKPSFRHSSVGEDLSVYSSRVTHHNRPRAECCLGLGRSGERGHLRHVRTVVKATLVRQSYKS